MPSGEEPGAILPSATDGRAVVRDHPLSLTVSISTP
ncbi:hypothetical protein EMIT0P201_12281 [Pseudomonas chlororaphis]